MVPLALPPITTPATPSSALVVWSFSGSQQCPPPLEAVAGPISQSVPSVQPASLEANGSTK
jgi:hypothetical protein